MDFDPYYNWLGIPPAESAGGGPNHYRLLGLNTFEENPDAISHAADRVMSHLRTFQTGKNAALSQKLLSEVAQAKICLLDPEKKAAYDNLLVSQAALPEPATLPAAVEAILPQPDVVARPPKRLVPKKPVHPRTSRTLELALSLGGLLAMIGAAVMLGYLWIAAASAPAQPQPTHQPRSTLPKPSESKDIGRVEKTSGPPEPKTEAKAPTEPPPEEPKKKIVKPKTPAKKKPAKKPSAKPKISPPANDSNLEPTKGGTV